MPWAWCQPVPSAHCWAINLVVGGCLVLGEQWGPCLGSSALRVDEFLFCHLPMSVPGVKAPMASTADVSVPCPSGLQGRCLPTGILWLRGWWWLGTGGHLQPWESVGP